MDDARDLRREMRVEAAKRWRKVATERNESLSVIKLGRSPDTLERKLMVTRHTGEMTPTLIAESARAKAVGVSDWLLTNAAERVVETPDFDEPKFLEVGLAIGRAGLGCGIGQGLTAGNTTAGIARNPGAAGNMFTSFILGMVLIESIAIYGLVIGFMLQGKIQ